METNTLTTLQPTLIDLTEYWLISYKWDNPEYKTVFDNDLHIGRVANWFLESKQQPENWKFISAQTITKEEYLKLKDWI